MRTNSHFIGMRRWSLWLFLAIFCSFNAFAQSQTISVDIENMPLGKAMEIISKKSDLKVAFSKEVISLNTPVSVKAANQRVDRVLNSMLKSTGVSYRIQNGSIMLYQKNVRVTSQTAPVSGSNDSQTVHVVGTVTDINGEPVIGATVAVP